VPNYKVVEGDCILNIAAQNGFPWDKIWNHPNNADLKQRRNDPNVLLPGDIVHIPDKTLRIESKSTDQCHEFVKKVSLAQVRLRLLDAKRQPRASIPYTATVDGVDFSGQTDGDGYLILNVPPTARDLILRVTDGQRTEAYALPLGAIDPIDSLTGVQQRLANLGYPCTPTGSLDEVTTIALRAFQTETSLPVTGAIDETTRQKLQQMHGC
jgi:hypothetical protein